MSITEGDDVCALCYHKKYNRSPVAANAAVDQEGIKEMNALYHKYLNNLTESHRLAKANRFPAWESDDAVLAKITSNARENYRLCTENNAILKEIVFSRDAQTLTADEVEELKEFADSLFASVQQADVGIAYKVHKLLYEYAKLHNDRDLYIRELYYLGVSLFFLSPTISEFGINLRGKEVSEYLREGAGYLEKLEEIESETTRAYVLRCLANLFLSDETINGAHNPGVPGDRVARYMHFKKMFAEIRKVLESPYYRSLVPNFHWDTLLYNLHFNRCLFYFNFQRDDLPDIVEDMLESAEYIYRHKEAETKASTMAARIEYLYAAVRRRAGLADMTEVIEVLLRATESADRTDYSAHGVTLNLQLAMYLEYTEKMLTDRQREIYGARIEKIVGGISDYLKNLPFNEYNNVVNNIIGEAISYCAQYNEPVNRRVFDYLLCCHTPTYIHVRLEASISRKIALQMIDTAPEKMIGVFGLSDVQDIIAQRDSIAQRVYDCALYHDVGKIMLLDYVEIYSRGLLDEEFEAIKLHSQIGERIMRSGAPEVMCHAALYHHCFHDGTGGYPRLSHDCPTKYEVIVDIVTVSDTIEAATDHVGRCYAVPKSFETIIEEIKNSCPQRYSSDVAQLFDDREFFDRIKTELEQERRAIYLELYREKVV